MKNLEKRKKYVNRVDDSVLFVVILGIKLVINVMKVLVIVKVRKRMKMKEKKVFVFLVKLIIK